jgi:hypothetical protein
MKKTLATLAAIMAALALTGCASTKKVAAKTDTSAAPKAAYGAWNVDKTAYTVDLKQILPVDSTIVNNADGSITVTYQGNWKQFIIPIPADDPSFMANIRKCTFIMSSPATDVKKFAWKLSNSLKTTWESGGGLLGQGDHCVGFMFRDYPEEWKDTPVELYFNGDETSFGLLTDGMYAGIVGLAVCDCQTQPKPFTFTIKSIVFTTETPEVPAK